MKHFKVFVLGFCLPLILAVLTGCLSIPEDINASSTAPASPEARPHPLYSGIDFERGIPAFIERWGGDYGTKVYEEEGVSYNGSVAMVTNNAGQGGGGIFDFYMKPNTVYKLTAWAKHSAKPSRPADIGIHYKPDPALDPVSFTIYFDNDKWEEGSVLITTGANVFATVFFIWKWDPDVYLYVDDIRLTEVGPAPIE